jgi:hypothetical protein
MEFLHGQEKKKVRNVLVYKTPKYMDRDWDNIAPIVSRFLIHIDKYMHGYSKILLHESQLETTLDVREFTEENFDEVRKEIYGNNVESKRMD